MGVRIYSTETKREEPLAPIAPDGVLRMYVCGMTPKYHPHVGHARVFVAMDVVRRYLEYRGYPVKHVQNFTDVDDKIIERAKQEGRDPFATARAYSDSYFEALDQLNVLHAHEYPKVTGYIEHIVVVVQALVDSGHAYVVDGDVYFWVERFPSYGRLSHRDLNSQLVAARKGLHIEPGKRDPRDFALWKAAKPGEPSWPSPWGPGRPGWHIECSTMVRETLGDQIDIHGGGSDLIFPHHENEIAQSEALTGKSPFAKHWVHAGLVTTEKEKMAHSQNNFVTIRDVLKQYEPSALRLYLIGAHYRAPLAFIPEWSEGDGQNVVRPVEDARASLARLRRSIGTEPLDPEGQLETSAVEAFEVAMDADFNTPDALAAIFDLAREVNRRRDAGASLSELDRGRRTLARLLEVLGVDPRPQERGSSASIEPFVQLLLDVRTELRKARQWAMADSIRDRLKKMSIEVEDRTDGGSTWRLADGA